MSTTWSKSVLRVAAEDARARFDFVDYFPSFELIASASSPRDHFAPDRRDVVDLGVAHVMRSFTRHYVDGAGWSSSTSAEPPVHVAAAPTGVVCDEETIEAAIDAS